MSATPTTRAQRRERWYSSLSPRAIGFRFLMGPQGHLLANSPLYRLPENLKLGPDTRLLDVGCGRGTLMRVLDEQVRFQTPPVGLDLSPEMLRMARADEAKRPLRGSFGRRFARGAASSLPFADEAFTLVTCGYVVKHLDDHELLALLREIRRVLEPGGLALIWEFGPSGNPRLDRWNSLFLGAASERVRLRSTKTLLHHAAASGFPFVTDGKLRPFLFPPIPRASMLIGIPPEGFDPAKAPQLA
jgi:SAM-dependent methyltransferase